MLNKDKYLLRPDGRLSGLSVFYGLIQTANVYFTIVEKGRNYQ